MGYDVKSKFHPCQPFNGFGHIDNGYSNTVDPLDYYVPPATNPFPRCKEMFPKRTISKPEEFDLPS